MDEAVEDEKEKTSGLVGGAEKLMEDKWSPDRVGRVWDDEYLIVSSVLQKVRKIQQQP